MKTMTLRKLEQEVRKQRAAIDNCLVTTPAEYIDRSAINRYFDLKQRLATALTMSGVDECRDRMNEIHTYLVYLEIHGSGSEDEKHETKTLESEFMFLEDKLNKLMEQVEVEYE
jgi:hypothetical protein